MTFGGGAKALVGTAAATACFDCGDETSSLGSVGSRESWL
jgi:hypothetical protein